MPDVNGTPSDLELLRAALDYAAKHLRVHLPATVEAYDAARGVATVRVDVGEYIRVEGEDVAEADPSLVEVPVEFPGGGGFRATWPLERGDTGLLLFCDRSLDEWKANAGGVVIARDTRRHHLTDAVFAPGLRRPAAPWAGARTDAMTVGHESGVQLHITRDGIALGEPSPAYAVALAEKVQAELVALRTVLQGWVPVATDGGLALKTALTNANIASPASTWGEGLGSSSVKVKD